MSLLFHLRQTHILKKNQKESHVGRFCIRFDHIVFVFPKTCLEKKFPNWKACENFKLFHVFHWIWSIYNDQITIIFVNAVVIPWMIEQNKENTFLKGIPLTYLALRKLLWTRSSHGSSRLFLIWRVITKFNIKHVVILHHMCNGM